MTEDSSSDIESCPGVPGDVDTPDKVEETLLPDFGLDADLCAGVNDECVLLDLDCDKLSVGVGTEGECVLDLDLNVPSSTLNSGAEWVAR